MLLFMCVCVCVYVCICMCMCMCVMFVHVYVYVYACGLAVVAVELSHCLESVSVVVAPREISVREYLCECCVLYDTNQSHRASAGRLTANQLRKMADQLRGAWCDLADQLGQAQRR
jgi:hypothetical protein